jgi:hypothetical protein
MSNIWGRPRRHPAPRVEDGRRLVTRQVISRLSARHANVILRYCEPVACDLETRAFLYDLDAALPVLQQVPRRDRQSVLA